MWSRVDFGIKTPGIYLVFDAFPSKEISFGEKKSNKKASVAAHCGFLKDPLKWHSFKGFILK